MRNNLKILTLLFFILLLVSWTASSGRAAGVEAEPLVDPLTIMVLGDSLGDGLYAGLYHLLRKDKNIKLLKYSAVGAGLHKLGMDKWRLKLEEITDKHSPDVAVILVGGNDPQPIIYNNRRREAFGTEKWRELYEDRVTQYINSLKDNGIEAFWVGMPVMRDSDYDLTIQFLNSIFQELAEKNGVFFISSRDVAVNDDGEYMAFGEDLNGKKRQLRMKDGKHFTLAGYEMLAHHVLMSMMRTLPNYPWGDQ